MLPGEIFSVILTSVSYPILSFQGTPIIKRLSLLTLIIFGEGITVACSNITDIIGTDGYEAWCMSQESPCGSTRTNLRKPPIS